MSVFRASPIFKEVTAGDPGFIEDLQVRNDGELSVNAEELTIDIQVDRLSNSDEFSLVYTIDSLSRQYQTGNATPYLRKVEGFLILRDEWVTAVLRIRPEQSAAHVTGVVMPYCVFRDVSFTDSNRLSLKIKNPITAMQRMDRLYISLNTEVSSTLEDITALRKINGQYPINGNISIEGKSGVYVIVKGGGADRA